MRSTLRWLPVLLLVFAVGCGGEGSFGSASKRVEAGPRSAAKDKAAPGETATFDEPAVGDPTSAPIAPDAVSDPSIDTSTPPPPPAAVAGAMAGTDRSALPRGEKLPQSGTLTAGSFDDVGDPQVYRTFLRKIGQRTDVANFPARFQPQRLVVTVRNADGQPVGNAVVRAGSLEFRTHSDGRVVLLPGWDRVADSWHTISVTPPGGATITHTLPPGADQADVTVASPRSSGPRNLDLAIVLDTTGSMGDEIRFLQSEIRSIATAVKTKFPQVNQRLSLVLYKDEGDEYVTKPFPFTESLDEFQRHLLRASAGGGGDEPEAMDRALEEAKQLRWREDSDTVRVLFLITDAPPHTPHMQRTFDAADVLRKKGVVIYPIACSGYNDAAEFVLRTCALMTGGQFLFLTNDSGVGDSHAEPHIPCYQVQKLDRLMVRMIASELSGKRVEAAPHEVLRSVGAQASRKQ